MKKEYEPPRIVHTEKLEGRAVGGCPKNSDAACGAIGPIMS